MLSRQGGTLISGSESTNAALTVTLYLISGSLQIFLQITGYLKIKVDKCLLVCTSAREKSSKLLNLEVSCYFFAFF